MTGDKPPTIEEMVSKVTAYEKSMPFLKIRTGGVSLKLATPNEKCLYFALEIERREPEINAWIADIPEGEVFFDVGANNGIYGLLAAASRGAQVVAFEPHFASYHVICRNIFANGLQDQVRVFPLALSAEESFGTFYLTDIFAGNSLNQFGKPVESTDPLYNAVIPQAAISTSLDAFVNRTENCPNHIKIDVDGLETDILAGAQQTLANPLLKSVCIETTEETDTAITGALKAVGFCRIERGAGNTLFFRD